MADFKKLHDDWKKAKKNAKLVHEGWSKLANSALDVFETGKVDTPAFPSFKLGLGPCLDNIQKAQDNIKKAEQKKKEADKKDTDAIAKNKSKADKAVKQYATDIAKVHDAVVKFASKEGKAKEAKVALLKYLEALEKVRDEIEDALKALK
jgi:septal ring factor EnvC (AmiA/AmiB activator)